jgi:mannose-6-phosphate isomerase-like protein (cupin superfamily)
LSAYVKAEHVDDWAGLWMRIDGPDGMISLDNMQNRPIRGTVDWQKVAIVLDVPQNSVGIAFGVLVQGVGRVWIDTVRFEVVGQNVPTTGIKEDTTPISQPSNLGFEAGLRGWSPESASQDYTIDIDPTVAHSGQASGHIQSKVAEPLGAGALSQYVKADNYRGKPLRITTSIKSDGVSAAARFVVYAFDSHNAILRSDSQPISSTAVWQRHDIILNVPDNSAQIAYGIVLEGQGQVWIDDVQIEVVGSQVLPAPLDRTIEQQPANLDFEAGNTGWSAAGSDTQEYVSGIDPTIAYRGQASGSIQSIVSRPDGLGLLRQTVKAGEYRDKRVRISGYLKTDRLNGAASFLMTIYGQQDQMIYSNSRSIDGPTDWQWFWLVLNVPVNSDRIEYGLALRGEGQVWIDDVRVELVGNDIETSSFETSPIQPAFIGPSQPGNLDFESDADLQAWFNSRNPDYEVSVDHRVVHSGSASAHIQSKATVSAGSYEVLSQFIRTDSYRGQRMRLSGYIKTNQVEGWAGMWMNIANSSNQLLVLDNMQNRPITGTIDWRKYEIVLDIPEDGAVIGFGALLQGKGEIWWDDVKLEIVGQDVPTTNPYQERPLNLDFENSK